MFREIPKVAGGEAVSRESLDELSAQRHLSHPNILPVLDYGDDAGKPFIVYPFCEGGNLQDRMQGRAFLPLSEAVPFLRRIAEAIDHAHANGYLHGDIKPENILFPGPGFDHPLLSDFGMSKYFVQPHPSQSGGRRSTTVMVAEFSGTGTFDYLSPEQLNQGSQSPKSDIYALAVVVYEVLAGENPYASQKTLFLQMSAKIQGKIEMPQSLQARLQPETLSAFKSALSPKESERPGSAVDFCKLLTGDLRPAAAPATWEDKAGSGKSWFHRLDTAGKVAVVTALIAAVGGLLSQVLPPVLEPLFR